MALQEGMQVIVGDLEAASSRRTRDESERHAVAAADARDRMAEIAGLRIEVADALGEFRRERVMQTAQDTRARAEAERERLARRRRRPVTGTAPIMSGMAWLFNGTRRARKALASVRRTSPAGASASRRR